MIAGTGALAVEFRDAGFSYGDAAAGAAVEQVDLAIPCGQCVVLAGASGCGKTTLTRMVNGLVPAVYAGRQTGRVLVGGKPMEEWGMDDLSCQVGSVFQNPRSQFFNLDTTSEIAFGCENRGLPRDEIRERVQGAAADLGIGRLLERDIRALSGGERQLVALASAYALGPGVFVLDEPTASLDADAMRKLAGVVARLKAAGKTIIVAEHRLWWLADVADRVVFMEGGRVKADWTAAQFSALSAEERAACGLRAWRLSEVDPAARNAAAGLGGARPRGLRHPGGRPRPGKRCVGPSDSRGACPAGVAGVAQAASAAEACPALEVSGLRAGYQRGGDVLRGIDLRLPAGCVAALVGRNGAGKTTLSRCIAGLHKEKAGTVALEGRKLSPRQRAGRAYLVMQETGYQLFADSVDRELEQACASGERLRAERAGRGGPSAAASLPDAAASLVERFGLQGLQGRHPLSLSGGQRQRLAIAAGVAQGARVMVLDEPTSGLDLGNMRLVAQELARLRDEGTCVLVVTHDFEFLCASCDLVVEMDEGAVRACYALDEKTLPRVRALFGLV